MISYNPKTPNPNIGTATLGISHTDGRCFYHVSLENEFCLRSDRPLRFPY